MGNNEVKKLTMEERLEAFKKKVGVNRVNRAVVEAGLPRGLYLSNHNASSDNIRRWALGVGELNPRYIDSEYAKATKYGRLVAPPLFLQSVYFAGAAPDTTEIDEYARPFHSGSEWEFYKPVLEGDEVDYNALRLIDVKLVPSKFAGQMMVMTSASQYTNQHGETVGLIKFFFHQSSSDEEVKKIGKYDKLVEPYKYTDEELHNIQEEQSKEEMRGSLPRYWEDVKEGDSVGPLVVGPHTVMDSVGHFSAIWGGFPLGTCDRSYKAWAKKDGNGIAVYDARINAYVNADLPHLDHDLARAVGAPGAYDNGGGRECIASILMTNWMGDAGFLWKYSIQFRRFNVYGDTTWYRGTVVRKYEDDGKYCVDIDHWGENQRGEKNTAGKATIILPSREHGEVKYPAPRTLDDIYPGKQ